LAALDSYTGLAVQIASAVIIARILTPEQTGVFAISAAFVALGSTFRDFGVAEYLIQERQLTRDRIRAAFTVNIAASWLMAASIAAASTLVGRYYDQAVIADIMLVQSLNFVLIPFGAVTLAWFRRELNYRPIVVCNLLTNLTSFSVSVYLALTGFGPIALAWGSLAGIAMTVIVAAMFRPTGFPRWPGIRDIGIVFHFSKFASAMYVIAQVGKGMPELVVGRAAGIADVGLFSRARGLVEMFTRLAMRPTLQICLPYFAKSEREVGSIVPAYLRSVSYLTAVGWVILGFLALTAFSAIRIIFGDQWLAAVPVAQVLCVACGVELPFILSREALLARGEVRRAGLLEIQLVAMQIAGLIAVFPYGLIGASYGLLGAAIAGFFVSQWHLRRAFGLRLMEMALCCGQSFLLAALALAPLGAAIAYAPIGENNYVRYGLLGAISTFFLWLLGARLTRHPLWHEFNDLAIRLWGRGISGARPVPPDQL